MGEMVKLLCQSSTEIVIDGSMGLFMTNTSDRLKPVKTGYASCPNLGTDSAPNRQGNVAVSASASHPHRV